jgi:hypothetical protein
MTTAIGCMGPVGAVIGALLAIGQQLSAKRIEKQQKAIMAGFSKRMSDFAAAEVNRIMVPAISPVLEAEIRNATLLLSQGTQGLHGLKNLGKMIKRAPKKMSKGVEKAGKAMGDWATGQQIIDKMKRKVAGAEAELRPQITKMVTEKTAYYQTPQGRFELRDIVKSVLSSRPDLLAQVRGSAAKVSVGTSKAPVLIAGAAAALLLTLGLTR